MQRRMRAAVVAVAVVATAGAAVAGAAWTATPSASSLAPRVEQRLGATGGRPVRLAAVSPLLARAVVATEDERFYRHDGIDVIGLLRAIPYDLTHLSFAQGASTITEQVAKLLYLNGNDHTPWRKLEDMALAVKLENRYSKRELLAAYLNTAYFGAGAYGVDAAARRYFGIPPGRVSLAQASLLAGLPQSPSAYDPLRHPAAARARQAQVLRSLVRVGALPAARAEAVLARPLALRGGGALPAVAGADVAPGPPLAWRDAAAGAALVLLGAVFLGARRRVRGRLVGSASAVAAAVVVAVGVAVLLRSFRTL